ncbi:MAG: hypothetical protein ABS54_16305 [Hyphomicrobium sp. SCN 65-11]|nr:MAG: hypothetical protein ABS54_16305 [Hyphomicrobium sp. SCN 65-11]
MTYVLAILSALAGLLLGWLVAAFGTLVLGSAFGLSDFEGERAMVAFFAIGPVGGAIGLVLGLWMWRKLRAGR